jgi:putative MFS transporter
VSRRARACAAQSLLNPDVLNARLRASGIVNTLGRGATIVTPFLVVMLFEARGVAGVMSLMIGLLVVQIVTVWTLGIEPRHRSLEELKGEDAAPAVLKEAS